METLCFESVENLSQMLAEKAISSVELTEMFIGRIKNIDPKVQAFLYLDEERSLRLARASDERRAKGQTLSPIDGIAVGMKDLIAEEGQTLTCGSKILEHYISPYDATVTQRLLGKGAVLLGRLNLDEFAMGSSTETSAYQKTHNPWNLEYVPGGSSGGSAAAVCSGEVPLSLGSDTGGSIRQPAACCGIAGLKPTYGLVSRYGLSALASSLDQIGPFARNVADLSMLLEIIAGHDERDSTSCNVTIPPYRALLKNTQQPRRIGVPREYFSEGIDGEVRQAVFEAIEFFRAQGHRIVDISLPHTPYAIPVYYVVMTAEASSNLARYDGIRYSHRSREATDAMDIYFKSRAEGFGSEVKRRIMLGTYVLSSDHHDAYYVRAQKVRTRIREDFMKAFREADVILAPTAPTTAFKFGEKLNDPLKMYMSDVCTVSTNLAGLPALSIPCGFSKAKMPIGLQFIGKDFHEHEILSIAYQFEKAHDFIHQFPPIN
ncbi:MAG: Asp-tRNA(Asn)/Glu-tRNA(Gln) amidotransferase subunit GatA [Puniceicoccales bacterium]|jgi:aspartyl-tRNA(Asn)/glutamyl-tRNA(Gln) amidotransferase subunit A|nr:Asp-tRNA(Asn)/Glu-tRNA(Gln) amidotransferase subunit GatA [Puniceicoccales bacterium]